MSSRPRVGEKRFKSSLVSQRLLYHSLAFMIRSDTITIDVKMEVSVGIARVDLHFGVMKQRAMEDYYWAIEDYYWVEQRTRRR